MLESKGKEGLFESKKLLEKACENFESCKV